MARSSFLVKSLVFFIAFSICGNFIAGGLPFGGRQPILRVVWRDHLQKINSSASFSPFFCKRWRAEKPPRKKASQPRSHAFRMLWFGPIIWQPYPGFFALQQDESPNFCVAATTDPGHGPTRSRRGFLVSSQRSSAAGLSWNARGVSNVECGWTGRRFIWNGIIWCIQYTCVYILYNVYIYIMYIYIYTYTHYQGYMGIFDISPPLYGIFDVV